MKRDRPHEPPQQGGERPDEKAGERAPVDLAAFKRASKPVHSQEAETIAPPSGEIRGREITRDFDDRGDRVTITNEVELETARLQSSLMSSLPPPPRRVEGPVTHASVLSMANAQAPTVPPPRDYESARSLAAAPASQAAPEPQQLEITGEARTIDPIVEMRERFSLGDYTGALQVAEAILLDDPTNAEVIECAEASREVLVKMYTARIGPMDRVPIVMVPRHQLRWLSIDHRAGFVLSHIDGMSSLEMILDVSGMPPLDALRILYELVQQRIIGFR